MTITPEIVDYVAQLSRLELSEEEKKQAEKDLGDILSYMDKLSELDTEQVEPMSHTLPVNNVMREDVCRPSAHREELLQNAPQKKDGCYQVPKAVE
nr:Asp-tRNA(Asn)/Glu-tRNA(Gln) amidotransferase subunit GatC [uncultured Solibaculum sp.]